MIDENQSNPPTYVYTAAKPSVSRYVATIIPCAHDISAIILLHMFHLVLYPKPSQLSLIFENFNDNHTIELISFNYKLINTIMSAEICDN